MKILRLGIILLCISSLAGASLSLVYMKTKDRIAQVKAQKIYRLQKEILPEAQTFEEIEGGAIRVGYDLEGNEVGKIVSVSPKGYTSNIEMLVGVDNQARITVVKIVKQSETPGLGAQIARDEFLKQFNIKSLTEIILIKDDPNGIIEGVTGATISSRAVAEGVKRALEKVASIE